MVLCDAPSEGESHENIYEARIQTGISNVIKCMALLTCFTIFIHKLVVILIAKASILEFLWKLRSEVSIDVAIGCDFRICRAIFTRCPSHFGFLRRKQVVARGRNDLIHKKIFNHLSAGL